MKKGKIRTWFSWKKTYLQFLWHFARYENYSLNQEYYRNNGNTTAIIKIAKKYNTMVLVSTVHEKTFLIEKGLPQEQAIVVTSNLKELRGKHFSRLLINDLRYTTLEKIEEAFPNVTIVGTFAWDVKPYKDKQAKTELMRNNLKHNKTVVILNGSGRSGKDTFAEEVGKLLPSHKVSSIDFVKQLYSGLDNEAIVKKTESYRKLLSQTKANLIEFDPMFFAKLMEQEVEKFLQSQDKILFVDIREPEEIEKFKTVLSKQEVEFFTVLVKRENIAQISSNSSDANVYNYPYDFIIENNSDIESLKDCARCLVVSTGYFVEAF